MWVKLGMVIPAIGIWSSLSASSSLGPQRVPPAVYPSSLKRRPYGVSCGKALWHVEQGWPVWRAKLGNAENRFWPECDTCCYKQQCGQQRAAEGADRRAVTLTSACDDPGMPNMGVIFSKIWAHLIPHVKSATRFRILTRSLRPAYTHVKSMFGMTILCDCGTWATPIRRQHFSDDRWSNSNARGPCQSPCRSTVLLLGLRGCVLVDIFLLRIMNSNQCFN